jgi:hypothetical protein
MYCAEAYIAVGDRAAGVWHGGGERALLEGKVQEEELDSCCAAGERRPEPRRVEGAGRNQHGFSLPLFAGEK